MQILFITTLNTVLDGVVRYKDDKEVIAYINRTRSSMLLTPKKLRMLLLNSNSHQTIYY